MVNWIGSHMGDILVLAILGLTVLTVVVSMVRDRKQGKHCGSCSGCAMAGSCAREAKKKSPEADIGRHP